MIISDPRFAAAYVTSAGDARLFDDIGDMLVYDQRMGEAVHAYWVHDLHSEAWARAETATFVTQSNLNTPMGWGSPLPRPKMPVFMCKRRGGDGYAGRITTPPRRSSIGLLGA